MHLRNLFIPSKYEYVRGERPDVACILCAIRDRDPRVTILEIFRTERFVASLNLHPYNAGHLFLFPMRHVLDIRDLAPREVSELHALNCVSLEVLEGLYRCSGFNLGWNLGPSSGASIEHLHQHIVPRYPREIGFLDILAGTKIVVEHPEKTLERVRAAFRKAGWPKAAAASSSRPRGTPRKAAA